MPDPVFRRRLAESSPLLADGAIGTLLQARSDIPTDGGFEALNAEAPDLVDQVHRDYIDAGAQIITTNTFAASTPQLSRFNQAHRFEELNRAGVDLARMASQGHEGILVAGAVGPLGIRLHPYGSLSRQDAESFFATQMVALDGVDLLSLETFTDLEELTAAVHAARTAAPDVPVVAYMTFGRDDRTVLGYLPGRVAQELSDLGADVVGVNCSGGPAQTLRIIQSMRQSVPDASLAAMPNAGYAERVAGRMLYRASPPYFAEAAGRLDKLGVTVIGGCCGTTPDHIRAMREALDDPAANTSTASATTAVVQTPAGPVQTLAAAAAETDPTPAEPTELANRLGKAGFIVTVEMTPPRSHDFDALLAAAALLRDAGATLLNVADSPAARMRMSPWAVGQVLQSQVGLETVLHFPTRGRNLLRIQGDLLAAHAMGLRNLFVTMGDPTRIGDYPQANDTSDIVPSALIGVIAQSMNDGVDMSGNSIGRATSFTVGCAVNMCAGDTDQELKVLQRKEANGAHFALGQAVFEPHRIEQFHTAYATRSGRQFVLPVLLGILPLYSVRQARFLHNEVPGITIPPQIFKRLDDAGEDAPAEGVRIAQELLAAVRPLVAGAYVIPSLGRYHLAAEVVAAAPTGPGSG